jgi:hypothetical protein
VIVNRDGLSAYENLQIVHCLIFYSVDLPQSVKVSWVFEPHSELILSFDALMKENVDELSQPFRLRPASPVQNLTHPTAFNETSEAACRLRFWVCVA